MPIRDDFLDEQLLLMNKITPWFTNICNFIVTSKFPLEASRLYKEKIDSDAKYYIWEDPYLWRLCSDQVIHKCILDSEFQLLLYFYHIASGGGHNGSTRIVRKVLDCEFYWPTIFKDPHQFVSACEQCQKAGMAISIRHEMPQQPIILQWIEAITTKTNDAKVVVDFLKSNIFYRFGVKEETKNEVKVNKEIISAKQSRLLWANFDLKQSQLSSETGSIPSLEGRLRQRKRLKLIVQARANAGPRAEYWVDCQKATIKIMLRLGSGWKLLRLNLESQTILAEIEFESFRPSQLRPKASRPTKGVLAR
ncbi:putative mitochondrial protein, partial [Mucuna pruriens]